MNNLIILLKIFLFLLSCLIGLNFIIYLYLFFSEKYKLKYRKKIEICLLDYVFKDKKQVELRELIRKRRITKKIILGIFLEESIQIINTINGELRKKIIYLCDEMALSKQLIKKIKNPFINKIEKELSLYQIGELRSKKHLNYFLNFDRTYIKKYDLYKGYFFVINNIVNEWIYELSDNQIHKYIDLFFIIIDENKNSHTINTKKLFEIFLTDTSNLFKYIINNNRIRRYMVNSLITKELPLAYKGELLYIMVLNFEYRVNSFIKKEFNKYIKKDDLTLDQLDYLVFLIKSLGEMGLKDAYPSFKLACKSNNWVIKSIASKYLYKYNEKESFDFLENFLGDSSWWVRHNASLSLDKLNFEGLKILIKTLNSSDKFAREVSAFTLASGSYFEKFKNNLIKDSQYLEGYSQLLETSFGSVFLERILLDYDIDIRDKLNIIGTLNILTYKDYFKILINRDSIEENIKNFVINILDKEEEAYARIY